MNYQGPSLPGICQRPSLPGWSGICQRPSLPGWSGICQRPSDLCRFAICYWGLTRSTRFVADSHRKHIFEPLKDAGIPFDVFLHTWEVDEHYVWWVKVNDSPDYTEHTLLNPVSFRRDSQSEFLDSIDFSHYYYSDSDAEWDPRLLRNHLCGLESQRRCTLLCNEHAAKTGTTYTHIIYVRPDARIYSTLPIYKTLGLTDNQILLTDSHHYEGYNDRFAAMKYNACYPYGNRIVQLREFRKNIGYIVSEKYVKYIVDTYYKPILCNFEFRLVRPAGDEV